MKLALFALVVALAICAISTAPADPAAGGQRQGRFLKKLGAIGILGGLLGGGGKLFGSVGSIVGPITVPATPVATPVAAATKYTIITLTQAQAQALGLI